MRLPRLRALADSLYVEAGRRGPHLQHSSVSSSLSFSSLTKEGRPFNARLPSGHRRQAPATSTSL